jgi:transcriptional regulator GlxA family with amidase domain
VPAARRRIGFLLFDGVKALDVIGPAEVFAEANLTADTYDLVFLSASGRDVMTSMAWPSASTPRHPTAVRSTRSSSPEASGRRTSSTTPTSGPPSCCCRVGRVGSRRSAAARSVSPPWAARRRSGDDALEVRGRVGLVATLPCAWMPSTSSPGRGDLHLAGVAAGIDLALCLVEDDLGADVARTVAQGLLVYMRRAGGQAQFSAPLRARTPRTSLGAAIAAYIAENPTRPLTVAELAAHVNVSTRHVTRVIRDELGMTAAAYVAAVRLSIAVGLLESGAAVTEAATSAGFPPSLRCGARSRRSTG